MTECRDDHVYSHVRGVVNPIHFIPVPRAALCILADRQPRRASPRPYEKMGPLNACIHSYLCHKRLGYKFQRRGIAQLGTLATKHVQ